MEKVLDYLKKYNATSKIIEFEEEIPTVETAAKQIGCTPGEIAKSLSLKIDDNTILIVMAGDQKIDNAKYKQEFGVKAKMLDFDEVLPRIGHPVGGVCPFAVNENVKIYLDVSLKKYDIVYPACGKRNNAIKLTLKELEEIVKPNKWVDVSKPKEY